MCFAVVKLQFLPAVLLLFLFLNSSTVLVFDFPVTNNRVVWESFDDLKLMLCHLALRNTTSLEIFI